MASELTIGCIPYLNLLPFYHGRRLGELPYVQASPRRLGRLVASGEVDAAPLAIVDSWRWQEDLQPIGDFGLACRGAVESVLVFSRRPLTELAGCQVRLTSESSTSAALLKLLLWERYELDGVRFEPGESGGDAFLVIGDAALRLANDPPPAYPHICDLGLEWEQWTAKPLVFARWVARRACSPEAISRLAGILAEQLEANLPDLGWVAGRTELDFAEGQMINYLKRFHYRLTEEDFEGASLFHHKVLKSAVGS